MPSVVDYPLLVLAICLTVSGMSVWVGSIFQHDIRLEFDFILGGVMTLLALIIGFTFAMAVNRYDQRKNDEAEEANAIGTEYLRVSLLPKNDAARVQALLRNYLGQRILTYTTLDGEQLRQINLETTRLQSEMWTAVQANAQAQPTPVASFIVAGMNDVLNSQGYTQAAWRNRIPISAWTLVLALSIFCNFLVGYGVQGRSTVLALALPIAVSIWLLLIADIDSPRHGFIRVQPQNLQSVVESLHSFSGSVLNGYYHVSVGSAPNLTH